MSPLAAVSATGFDPFAPTVALTAAASVGGDWLSTVFLGIAQGPDLLRLVAVPVFAWAAYRDVKTRRVPNRTWLPLLAVGFLALAWDVWLELETALPYELQLFAVQVALSLGLVAPLGYVFWRLGGFGGADAKALITLAVLFPVYPTFYVDPVWIPFLDVAALPYTPTTLGVFSLTILSNTVLAGLAYPLVLALRNLPRGEVTPAMFIGRPVAVDDLLSEYGRLLENPDGFTRRGLDVDALRMYLRWRGVTLADLRADPERYRHPLPTERNDPGDGSIVADERARTDGRVGDDGIATDGGVVADEEREAETPDGETDALSDGEIRPAIRPLDAWGAERFLAEHSAYGTTPTELREGLAVLTEPDRESVWLTPGIPFIVPMFVGLVVALTYGDVLFALLAALGLA